MGVDEPLAARLRGVSGAASEVQLLANQMDAELRNACAAIVGDLGTRRAFASAPLACQAAVDALRTARTKLGTAAKIAVDVHPPICPVSMTALSDCAKHCNPADDPAPATCAGATAGRCPGACDGMCEMRPSSQCDGVCAGKCDGTSIGVCEGTCKGTCNGAEMKQPGACKGTCEGSCDAIVKGPCKGACRGGCQLKASACSGLCTGKCSVALEDPKCLGPVAVRGSAECAASCEMRAVRQSTCGAAQVDVRVDGVKDKKQKSTYESTIERNLPVILKVEAQLRNHVATIGRTKAAVAAGLKAITDSQNAALSTLSPCLFGYDKASVEGTDGLLASHRAATDAIAAAKSH
jgi:hypothetical protein